MNRTLSLKRDALTELGPAQLGAVVGAAATVKTACEYTRGVCELTDGCFTHHTSLDCHPTEICPTNGCG